MICAIQYPSWIKPEIIPGFPLLRWYGLMCLVAFAIAFVLFRVQVKKGELQRYAKSEKPITNEDIIDFFTWSILGLMLGARIFATLVYEPTWMYWQKPWLIFWPFSESHQWTGLQGMSYHGGFIGCFLGAFLWAKRHKQDFFAWADTAAAGIPLGYTFGRLGNFFNGELYGRITTSPIGMIFPSVPLHDCFPVKEAWVREFAAKAGVAIQGGAQYVNLPRHPSQLYEALLTVFYFVSTLSAMALFGFLSNTSVSLIMNSALELQPPRMTQIFICLTLSKIFLLVRYCALR